MTLKNLHDHFKIHGVEFFSLDTNRNYLHCIYIHTESGLKFSIPKIEPGKLKPELVATACEYFRIPIPDLKYSE